MLNKIDIIFLVIWVINVDLFHFGFRCYGFAVFFIVFALVTCVKVDLSFLKMNMKQTITDWKNRSLPGSENYYIVSVFTL